MTVIDMTDPYEAQFTHLAFLKGHLRLMSKGMKHSSLTMTDVLEKTERALHNGKRVYTRSRKGCEQAIETIGLEQERMIIEKRRTVHEET